MSRIAIAACGLLLLSGTAFAQDMKCDESTTMMVERQVSQMSADMNMQKDEAMKHLDMAKEAMKANNAGECSMHLQEAQKATMNKM